MLRVTVELVPFGVESKKHEIAKMEIINDGTGTNTKGNYDVRVFVRNSKHVMRKGKVSEHSRLAESVWTLVDKAIRSAGYTVSDHG